MKMTVQKSDAPAFGPFPCLMKWENRYYLTTGHDSAGNFTGTRLDDGHYSHNWRNLSPTDNSVTLSNN